MAPTRQKKRKSTDSENAGDLHNHAGGSGQTISTKAQHFAHTPTNRSPIRKGGPMRITLKQKQALVDNLQLEITERARKLRGQYARQAESLRTRIEIKINRIPMALRKANMGELFAKYSSEASSKPQPAIQEAPAILPRKPVGSPAKNLMQETQSQERPRPSPTRVPKRMSDEITDKENADLSNPKKRTKPLLPPERTTSRPKPLPTQVLSPRSANSRTVPRSPTRQAVAAPPAKSMLSRPISPLKPVGPTTVGGAAGILTGMVEKASGRTKTTRAAPAARNITASSSGSSAAGVGRGRGTTAKAGAATATVGKGRARNGSDSSSGSAGTVVVGAKTSPAKRTVMGAIRGISGGAAAKGVAGTGSAKVSKPATATRVLRKRNAA